MNKHLSTLMAVILLMACNTKSPKVFKTDTPIDLAQSIFDKEHLSDVTSFATGEYDGRFTGKDMDDSITRKFTLLEQKEKTAVVAMTLVSPSGKGDDLYLHFEKDSTWKVNAVRALAMTGMIAEALKEMEKLTPQQLNEAIKKGQIKSKEEFDFDLGNSRLTLAMDDSIIKHFETNKQEFERIKNAALEELKTKTINEEQSTRLVEKLKADYRKLFISSVYFGDYEVGGNCISFTIGGMIDNTVGYLYAADKKDLPEMNPRRLIMLKEIGNGWYLYKTT
jgi:hypothetical protein